MKGPLDDASKRETNAKKSQGKREIIKRRGANERRLRNDQKR